MSQPGIKPQTPVPQTQNSALSQATAQQVAQALNGILQQLTTIATQLTQINGKMT